MSRKATACRPHRSVPCPAPSNRGSARRRPCRASQRPLVLVSGGQTGADRGALEAARACRVPIIGWCPGGRWTETGPLASCWPLVPTSTRRPIERTLRNLHLADGVTDPRAAAPPRRQRCPPAHGRSRLSAPCPRSIVRPVCSGSRPLLHTAPGRLPECRRSPGKRGTRTAGRRRGHDDRLLSGVRVAAPHSHSMVPGGFEVTS